MRSEVGTEKSSEPRGARPRRRARRPFPWIPLLASLLALGVTGGLFAWSSQEDPRLHPDLPGGRLDLQVLETLELEVREGNVTTEEWTEELEVEARAFVERMGEGGWADSFLVQLAGIRLSRDGADTLDGGFLARLERNSLDFFVRFYFEPGMERPDDATLEPFERLLSHDPLASLYLPRAAAAPGVQWRVDEEAWKLAQAAPSLLEAETRGHVDLEITGFLNERLGGNERRVCEVAATIELQLTATVRGRSASIRAVGEGRARIDVERGVVVDRREQLSLSGRALDGGDDWTLRGELNRVWRAQGR